ncbi:gliding motility-associated C-terminal domain-containing protein [Hymenobacter sp. APR13]|uniref:T9SS type B sorting domain-containing protein n=1 Tax=Hymenobacter sp. APR13 TaxID=1356852 RepID=UPI0004E05AB3|nr:gliding motility-associated C-terminal domain-containing protein [Hymenobacter sp. APR13]AII50404.1 hypothetical protein N008_00205 [Hymenobacter sp. APR13]
MLSDEEGNLQCYSDGERVYNRQEQLMGVVLPRGSRASSTQGALLLRAPGDANRCYLFTVDQAENSLQGGLHYSIIDLRLNNGLGGLTSTLDQAVPTPATTQLLAEKLTAVRHANGRDYWVLVHGWNDDAFYAYLLSPAGLASAPVMSRAGRPHIDPNGATNFQSALGYLRVSPNGLRIAAAISGLGVDCGTFNPATGRVSNVAALPVIPFLGYSGLEFSPDNSKLYVTDEFGSLRQIDLATQIVTEFASTNPKALALGPDQKIYLGVPRDALGIIHEPNLPGLACRFQKQGLDVAPGFTRLGLPNFPNAFAASLRIVARRQVCVGARVEFQARLSSGEAVASAIWTFGNPAAGPANSAVGLEVQHTYQQPGTYQVVLSARNAAGIEYMATETIEVQVPPSVRISPPDPILCTDPLSARPLVLSVPEVPGATYRWQNGSTASSITVNAAGRYRVQVTTSGGCISQDSTLVQERACQVTIPNIITPNQDGRNETFVLKGLVASEWRCCIFNRWGRLIYKSEAYQDDWSAAGQADGIYYYYLTSTRTGQVVKGTVEVMR